MSAHAFLASLHEELSWSISKVDDELTPIVQRIARRGKAGALNKQATLDPFFDVSVASGNYAPRRRTTANVSKRLMAVIKDFRDAEARLSGQQVEGWGEMLADIDADDPKGSAYARKGSSQRLGAQGSRSSLKNPEKMEDTSTFGTKEDEEESKKAPAKRKRKSAKAKAVEEESEYAESQDQSRSQSGLGDQKDEDEEALAETLPKKPAKKKRVNRGTRRWVGPRWDVIEKPTD